MGIQRKIENLQGQAKEKAGQLTDNDELEEAGIADQKSADAKERVDRAAELIAEKIDSAKDKLKKD